MSKPCESKDGSRKTGSQMWHSVVARNSFGLPFISCISPSEDDLRKQLMQVNLAVLVWFCFFLFFSSFFPAHTMWKDKNNVLAEDSFAMQAQ